MSIPGAWRLLPGSQAPLSKGFTMSSTITSRVVYIGRRLLAGHKIAYWYRELGADGSLGAAKGATEPYQAGLSIGAVLEVQQPASDPMKILVAGPRAPRVVAAWSQPADVERWRLEDRADAQAAAVARRAQTDLRDISDTFEEALDVLSEHFALLTFPQRAALLPLVQARILGSAP